MPMPRQNIPKGEERSKKHAIQVKVAVFTIPLLFPHVLVIMAAALTEKQPEAILISTCKVFSAVYRVS